LGGLGLQREINRVIPITPCSKPQYTARGHEKWGRKRNRELTSKRRRRKEKKRKGREGTWASIAGEIII